MAAPCLRRGRSVVAILLLSIVSALAGAVGAVGAEPVTVEAAAAVVAGVDRLDLSDRLEICATAPERTMDDVLATGCDFRPARAEELTIGYSRRAHWLRLRLIGGSDRPEERWLVVGHRRLERVSLAVIGADGGVARAETGLAVPPALRPTAASDPILPLRLGAGERVTVVARVVSQTSINLATVLWRPQTHQAVRGRLEFWEAAAAGGLIAAAAFSLAIAAAAGVSQWSRRANLWFGLVLSTKAVFNVANAALIPVNALPIDWAYDVRVQAVAMGASTLCYLLFARHLVDSRRRWPRWDGGLWGLIAAMVAATAWASFVDYGRGFQVQIVLAAASVIAVVAVFERAWRAGFPAAGFLLAVSAVNLVPLLHRVALAFSGWSAGEGLQLFYSWSYVLTAPLIPIGITLHETALREAMEKARAEATARVEFLARVSHELRTPLDTILGNAQLLSRPSGAPLMREGLAIIHDSGRHLLRMIDDLLDHARGVAGRLAVTPVTVDWPGFLASVEQSGRTLAARGGNRFALAVGGASPAALRVDGGRLRQVLDNLLANAARHTRDGRIEVDCEVGPADARGRVVVAFTVADSGEGIAAADQERIFLPFERGGSTEARHGGKGIGMGLTIARQLVEAMGGHLTVASRPGAGATFRFTVEAAVVEDVVPATVEAAPASTALGRGRRVVVVDDADANRRVLAHFFADCGFAVIEAASGRRAVEAVAAAGTIDLVVTDQFMADGDGWSVLRRLATLRPEVPVILVSAAPPERPADFPAGLDFAAHFLKPLDHRRLVAVAAELLGVAVAEGEAAVPVDEPAAASLPERPDAAVRAELQALVEEGRFGEVMRRAEATMRSQPQFAAFGEAVRAAARRLDLADLDRLLGESEES